MYAFGGGNYIFRNLGGSKILRGEVTSKTLRGLGLKRGVENFRKRRCHPGTVYERYGLSI